MQGKNSIPDIPVWMLCLITFLMLAAAYLALIRLAMPFGSMISIAFSLMALVSGRMTVAVLQSQ
jgi:hypothetical protein